MVDVWEAKRDMLEEGCQGKNIWGVVAVVANYPEEGVFKEEDVS